MTLLPSSTLTSGDIAASITAREKILVLWSANRVFLLETPSVTTGST